MFRNFIRQIIRPRSSFQKLLVEARTFPRYREHEFTYNNIFFKTPDFLSVVYQLKEYFIDNLYQIPEDRPTPVIYDCGANVGVCSLYFSKHYPHAIIKAFEPDPNILNYLNENLCRNKARNVKVVEKAVWVNSDGIKFGSEGADGGSAFYQKNIINVPSLSLRSELECEKEVTFLKIDIEGAEVEVINDCYDQLHKVKYLFIEYHSWCFRNQELSSILWVLEKTGFRYFINSNYTYNSPPFLNQNFPNSMDVQLNIYAINQVYKI